MMTGSLREFISERRANGEFKTYDSLRNAMMNYAVRKKQEWNREHAENAMDIGQVAHSGKLEEMGMPYDANIMITTNTLKTRTR